MVVRQLLRLQWCTFDFMFCFAQNYLFFLFKISDNVLYSLLNISNKWNVAKEKEATCYMDKTSGALCSVALLCQYKVSRWVEGAPITISFYLKSREAPKEKRKLIFILQEKATHSYRRPEFAIFRDFVLLVPLSISIQYFKHSSEHAITLASK